MNETKEADVVELGEAKEVTKGWMFEACVEDNPDYPTRPCN